MEAYVSLAVESATTYLFHPLAIELWSIEIKELIKYNDNVEKLNLQAVFSANFTNELALVRW